MYPYARLYACGCAQKSSAWGCGDCGCGDSPGEPGAGEQAGLAVRDVRSTHGYYGLLPKIVVLLLPPVLLLRCCCYIYSAAASFRQTYQTCTPWVPGSHFLSKLRR